MRKSGSGRLRFVLQPAVLIHTGVWSLTQLPGCGALFTLLLYLDGERQHHILKPLPYVTSCARLEWEYRQWKRSENYHLLGGAFFWALPTLDKTSCEPENLLGEDSTCLVVLSFNSPLFDYYYFFNTKVSNTGEGAPRSVHTGVYSDTIPQTIALCELRVEEWTAKINRSSRVHMGYLHKY